MKKELLEISVLYAEDDKIIRSVYSRLLSDKVKTLYIAENGKEGLEIYKMFKPDLILTDIKMPIMDGLEMLEHINEYGNSSKVIVISAYSQVQFFLKAINLGVNNFLLKPIEKDQLYSAIQEQADLILLARNILVEEKKRREAEEKIKRLNNELEKRVETRTSELKVEINERKFAETMLRESEEKYRQIFENANDGIILTVNGIIEFMNPKIYEITGYLPKECISKPFVDFVYADDQKLVKQNHRRRLEGKITPESIDIRSFSKNGDLKWIEIKSTLINWEQEPAILTFFADITERKETEKQLEALNSNLEKRVKEELTKIEKQQQLLIQKSKLESLGELAAGIAHEINQPLGGISMALDNITIKLDDDKANKKYLKGKIDQLFGDIDRIRNIISHIRAFSRDQEKSELVKVDLNEVIDDVLSMVNTQYKNHSINFSILLEQKNHFILGHKFKLEQVLLNLLSNAKFAIDEKGRDQKDYEKKICIITKAESSGLSIIIEDNGIGIHEKNIQKIFDPFYTTKKEELGTGLGLSISYGIISEMNGSINAESKKDNYTKMTIVLPYYK